LGLKELQIRIVVHKERLELKVTIPPFQQLKVLQELKGL
jgi:hypothetical protein